jgi:hypothetical protein
VNHTSNSQTNQYLSPAQGCFLPLSNRTTITQGPIQRKDVTHRWTDWSDVHDLWSFAKNTYPNNDPTLPLQCITAWHWRVMLKPTCLVDALRLFLVWGVPIGPIHSECEWNFGSEWILWILFQNQWCLHSAAFFDVTCLYNARNKKMQWSNKALDQNRKKRCPQGLFWHWMFQWQRTVPGASSWFIQCCMSTSKKRL